MLKDYKKLSEKKLVKVCGGWGYSLVFYSPRSWERAIRNWIKR